MFCKRKRNRLRHTSQTELDHRFGVPWFRERMSDGSPRTGAVWRFMVTSRRSSVAVDDRCMAPVREPCRVLASAYFRRTLGPCVAMFVSGWPRGVVARVAGSPSPPMASDYSGHWGGENRPLNVCEILPSCMWAYRGLRPSNSITVD